MRLVLALLLASLASPILAGQADVVAAKVSGPRDSMRFDVTVRHGDEGWDHYADAWRVKGPDGVVYGTRELLHPHVDEQPFTRSLSGIQVPPGVSTVTIEARDSVHGWGGETVEAALPD